MQINKQRYLEALGQFCSVASFRKDLTHIGVQEEGVRDATQGRVPDGCAVSLHPVFGQKLYALDNYQMCTSMLGSDSYSLGVDRVGIFWIRPMLSQFEDNLFPFYAETPHQLGVAHGAMLLT